MEIYLDNTNVIQLKALTDSLTNTVDTAATVRVTIVDDQDVEITGETWPVLMNHAGAGTYQAALADTLTLTEGDVYKVVVNVVGSSGSTAKFNCRVRAEERWCS